MTIAEIRDKCNAVRTRVPRDVLVIGVLIGACTLSFGLGYLAGRDSITQIGQALRPSSGQGSEVELSTTPSGSAGEVVASKTGTKYYLPTCPGVDRISLENKVYFLSAALARAEGYEPASNCDGL